MLIALSDPECMFIGTLKDINWIYKLRPRTCVHVSYALKSKMIKNDDEWMTVLTKLAKNTHAEDDKRYLAV